MKTTPHHRPWGASAQVPHSGARGEARSRQARRQGTPEEDAVAKQLREDWGFINRVKAHHASARRLPRPGVSDNHLRGRP